jgi:putative tricarboxylic transport membrane protein
VAILLPLTFTMPPTSAIILLTCIYWGALFGGAITSVLFNIPGEPWSVATTFDGYPLAKDGQSGQALTAAFTSSFVGAFFSIVLITFFAPLLAEVALKFGPPEFFAIQLLTFSSFVGLGGGSALKSLATILIGFMLSTVGLDIVTGQLRLTYGFTDLMKGFDFIIAVIGLFGIGEILLSVEEGLRFQGAKTDMNLRVVLDTWKVLPRFYRTFVRSSVIGFWMGFKPGGATPASFMSYAFAKRFSKNPERFGKGEIEGIVAPETAAHAAGVAAMLPMITLGIPGSPTAAVMLGGLIIWGLQPGPMLFVDNPDFVWGLIASMYTGNVIGVLIVLAFVPFFASILRIPFAILTPLIIVICAIGSYAVHNSMIDIWYMLIFGVIGYVFKKLDYPLAPLVLALVLGDMAENALRQSLIMSQGSLAIFFTRPISGVITAVAIFFFVMPVLTPWWRKMRGLPQHNVASAESATEAE